MNFSFIRNNQVDYGHTWYHSDISYLVKDNYLHSMLLLYLSNTDLLVSLHKALERKEFYV